jgi:hypothetical protein
MFPIVGRTIVFIAQRVMAYGEAHGTVCWSEACPTPYV